MAGPRYRLYRTRSEKTGKLHPKWRIRYTGPDGREKAATGFTDKRETERLAAQLAMQADEIRRGNREAPKPSDTESLRPIQEHVDAYLTYGNAQGGRGGRPWAPTHACNRKKRLGVMIERMGARTLRDVTLPVAEGVLLELQKTGLHGKTLNHYAEALHQFMDWCRKRKYVEGDPLEGLRRFDGTPKTERRALTADEIGALLATAPPERALVYRVALCTGLRHGELESLRVGDFDTKAGTILLPAEHAKSRRAAALPVPRDLAGNLQAFVEDLKPTEPLLHGLTPDYAHCFERDLERAGITRKTFRGVASFHSLRVTFVTLAGESGCDARTMMELARHATPDLTLRVYAKSKEENLRAAAERIGKVVADAARSAPNPHTGVKREHMKKAAGGEGQTYPEELHGDSANLKVLPPTGFEPVSQA